jgi:hypothetical protein
MRQLARLFDFVLPQREQRLGVLTPDIRGYLSDDREVPYSLPPLARIFATPYWQASAHVLTLTTSTSKRKRLTERIRYRRIVSSLLHKGKKMINTKRRQASASSSTTSLLLDFESPNVLDMYIDADDALCRLTHQLSQLPPDSIRYLAPYAHSLHQQHLKALHRLSKLAIPRAQFGPHAYRLRIPAEDRDELERDGYCESVLFAARALARGYRIRGAEQDTLELRQLGVALYAAYEAARVRIRCELSRVNVQRVHMLLLRYDELKAIYYGASQLDTREADEWTVPADACPVYKQDALLGDPEDADACALQGIRSVLLDFHRRWVAFERAICRCYFCTEGHRPGCRHQDMINEKIVQQWRRVLADAVHNKLLDAELIAEVDPGVVIALPRLALLDTVLNSSTQPLVTTSQSTPPAASPYIVPVPSPTSTIMHTADPDPHPDIWWTGTADGLVELRTQVQQLTPIQLQQLQRRLVLAVTAETEVTPSASSDPAVMDDLAKADHCFRDICAIADALHCGPLAPSYRKLFGHVLDNFSAELEVAASSETFSVLSANDDMYIGSPSMTTKDTSNDDDADITLSNTSTC